MQDRLRSDNYISAAQKRTGEDMLDFPRRSCVMLRSCSTGQKKNGALGCMSNIHVSDMSKTACVFVHGEKQNEVPIGRWQCTQAAGT